VSTRLAAVIWLLLGVAVWCGFFELYIERGANQYLEFQAEAELGRGPEPSMADVMARARHRGEIASTAWAVLVVGAGWGTLLVRRGQ
jgi:hypothetical protein